MSTLSLREPGCRAVGPRAAPRRAQPPLWLATTLLAVLVFVNEANFRPSPVEPYIFDWQIGLRLLVSAACGAYGLLFWRDALADLCRGPYVLALLLGIWATVCVGFAVKPLHSTGATSSLWCMLLFAPTLVRQLDTRRIAMTMLGALLAYLAASWVAQFVAPDLGAFEQDPGEEPIFRLGGLSHPNTLGRQAALAVAMAFVLGLEGQTRWRTLAAPVVFALVTLACTGSRTSAVIVLACCCLVGVRKSKWLFLTGAAGAVCVGGLFIAAAGSDLAEVSHSLSRSEHDDEISTLTGRTALWEYTRERIAESPVVGYGYGCGRFVIAANEFWSTHHAHNVVLNMSLLTGVVGGGLVVCVFLALLAQALWRPESFPDVVGLAVLVGGLTESNIFNPTADSNTLALLMALCWRQVRPPVADDPAKHEGGGA